MGKISSRDRRVELRNNILIKLDRGAEALNKGDRTLLSHTLKYIHNELKEGFSVDTNPTSKHEFFNDEYTSEDGMIVIKEDDRELIAIIKLKSGLFKGQWMVYELSQYEFQYDSELDAEAQWEKDADSAYEKYLDYKASFDDPRGQ